MVTAARMSTHCLQLPSSAAILWYSFLREMGWYLGKLTVVSCEIAMRRATMGMYSEIWGNVHSQCQPSLKATGGAWSQILRIVSGLKRMELEAVLLLYLLQLLYRLKQDNATITSPHARWAANLPPHQAPWLLQNYGGAVCASKPQSFARRPRCGSRQ